VTGRYGTPRAFEQALKAKLKERIRDRGGDFNRMLQTLLFERFLVRLYEALGEAVIVKGGLAMELRLTKARTTRDVDLRVEGDLDDLVHRIRLEAARQGDDFLTFDLGSETDFRELLGEQVVYGGRRITVQARLAGKRFGGPFRLDLSLGDRILTEPETTSGTDLLEFAEIAPVVHRIYPAPAHVAEKLHALTIERDSPNSRVKDLIDVGLLASNVDFDAEVLHQAIIATFEFRGTHELPDRLPSPPEFWADRYESIRERDSETVPWETLEELQTLASRFLNPILSSTARLPARWSPLEHRWREQS